VLTPKQKPSQALANLFSAEVKELKDEMAEAAAADDQGQI
jgi:hypothetical protein